MNKIEVVLFDLDGTLVDTKNLIITSFQRAAKDVLNIDLPAESIRKLIGIPLKEQMDDVAPEHGQALMDAYRRHNAILHDELIRYFDGTKEMLATLREQGKRLGIVTSKRHEPALEALQSFDLQDNFELLIGMDDFPIHKPQPEPLLHAAQLMGLNPGTPCVYVGDSPFDMQAALSAKMHAIAATWGIFTHEELSATGVKLFALSPLDIPRMIAELK